MFACNKYFCDILADHIIREAKHIYKCFIAIQKISNFRQKGHSSMKQVKYPSVDACCYLFK